MKPRVYVLMQANAIKETTYPNIAGKKPSHVYSSSEVEIQVFGTFKNARTNRQQLDYAVLVIAQANGFHAGKLSHE